MRTRALFVVVVAIGLCTAETVSFAGTAPARTDTALDVGPVIEPQELGGTVTGGQDLTEDWESYNDGEEPCGQNGWEEWSGSTDVCGHVSTNFANSGDKSFQLIGAVGGQFGLGDDTVQRFSIDGGQWIMKIETYMESGAGGNGWVAMSNRYPTNINWSVQVRWENASGRVVADFDLESVPIVYDTWQEFRLEIDLDADTVDYFYGGFQFIDDKSWINGVTGNGDPNIRALDLYGGEPGQGGVTAFYLDDVSLLGQIGACCLPDGSCTDDGPGVECDVRGGRFAVNTLCEDIEPPCIEQTGACCTEGGGCVRDPEWCCDVDVDGDCQVNPVDSGLVEANFGSDDPQDLCNYDVDCDGQINAVDSGLVQRQFGQCNEPGDECGGGGGKGRCEQVTGTECGNQGGEFLGFGTDCADDACGFTPGACCVELDCAGTMRQAACDDLDGRWHIFENCEKGFRCPERSGCAWDNSIVPNGVNGRAISPPSFPLIRVVDDFVTDDGCFLQNIHANISEDVTWTHDGQITVTVYKDTGNGPGAIVDSVVTGFTSMATGDIYFGRLNYDYSVEELSIELEPGTYWVGLRNEGGGGSGTNYWMTSDGGVDGRNSSHGYFSLDGGNTWSPEGDRFHHAFEIVP